MEERNRNVRGTARRRRPTRRRRRRRVIYKPDYARVRQIAVSKRIVGVLLALLVVFAAVAVVFTWIVPSVMKTLEPSPISANISFSRAFRFLRSARFRTRDPRESWRGQGGLCDPCAIRRLVIARSATRLQIGERRPVFYRPAGANRRFLKVLCVNTTK